MGELGIVNGSIHCMKQILHFKFPVFVTNTNGLVRMIQCRFGTADVPVFVTGKL
jgi:hypothetical protein